MLPPVVVTGVAPEVPDIAMRARYFVPISVDVQIGADGAVLDAILQPGTREIFGLDTLALRAAREWRFDEAAGCKTRRAWLTFDFQKPVPIGTPGGSRFKPP